MGHVFQNQPGHNLKYLDLSHSRFSQTDLENLMQFLSARSGLEALFLNSCEITAEASPYLVDLIQQSPLKTMCLCKNPLETQGMTAILQAVRTSRSMRILLLGDGEAPDCPAAALLEDFLSNCHLTTLSLEWLPPMERETVEALAEGLRRNNKLKILLIPCIECKDLWILGNKAVVENRTLESFSVGSGGDLEVESDELEDESMCSFIELLPQMKSLKTIFGLFDRKPSRHLVERTIEAVRENTVLEEVWFDRVDSAVRLPPDHLFNNCTIQYYLELNRWGRKQFLESMGEKSLCNSLVPLILARMTRRLQLTSHLFYFLRCCTGLLQSESSPADSSSA